MTARTNANFPERLTSAAQNRNADLLLVLPQPTDAGVAELRRLYYARFERELDEASAREALTCIITILWNTALIKLECSDTASMLANPTTNVK